MSRFMDAFTGHDWTGVFVSGAPSGEPYVVLTACHHTDDVFYELGVVRHEVTPAQLLAAVPNEPPHDCQAPDVTICWMLDFHDENGDLVDNREVTAEQAAALLGADLEALLAVGQANHQAWVDHPVHNAA